MPEDASIADVLAGSVAAFANIVEAYQRPVYSLAFRMLGHREDAADATQETFLKAYHQLASYDAKRPFGTWLLSIAAHHCVDLLRRHKYQTVDLVAALTKRDVDASPEDMALMRERCSAVKGLVETLTPPYRLVVVLRYWQDLSYEEIGQVTGLSVAAVKSRLHRARALLLRAVQARSTNASSSGDEPNGLRTSQTPTDAVRGRDAGRRHGGSGGPTPERLSVLRAVCHPA